MGTIVVLDPQEAQRELEGVVDDLSRAAVRLNDLVAWLTVSGGRLEHIDDPERRVPAQLVMFAIQRMMGAAEAARNAAGDVAAFAAPQETHSSLARLRLRPDP